MDKKFISKQYEYLGIDKNKADAIADKLTKKASAVDELVKKAFDVGFEDALEMISKSK